MLTRNGLVIPDDPNIKKELTVRPVENALGIRSPSFKVWRKTTDGRLIVPRYFPTEAPARDSRPTPDARGNINFTGKLRDQTNQNEAFAAGTNAFAEKGGGVLSLPPGYGKTTMALALASHLKVQTMIVVHKEFLANQWRDRIAEFCPGATIGRIQGDIYDVQDKDFVIALIQTMCMREFPRDAFDSFGLLIVDEAHHIGAPAFSQFMFKICPKYTLGLTATPERKDGLTRLLYWFLGPEFFRVERTAQKSTRVEVLHYTHDAFTEAPPVTRFGNINMAAMVTAVTELEDRNAILVERINRLVSENNRRVLVLSDRREHCFEFQRRLGSKSALYIGGMAEKDLAESAKAPVVLATFQLAQEGLDIPELDTCILATPKSDIKQAIGRIMRETPGKKNSPLIIDVVDHWSVFFSMWRKRTVVYRLGGFEILDSNSKTEEVTPSGQCLFITEGTE